MIRSLWKRERRAVTTTVISAVAWALLWFDSTAWYQLPEWLQGAGFTSALALVVYWLRRSRAWGAISQRATESLCLLPVWQSCVFTAHFLGLDALRAGLARAGLAASFVIGLAWTVWLVETRSSRYRERRRKAALDAGVPSLDVSLAAALVSDRDALARGVDDRRRRWNPLDLDAWYWGRRRRKLNQSIGALSSYSVLFLTVVLLLLRVAGCSEIYEMPAGGGEQKQLAQLVKVQKVIKKKYVINPFSAIVFNPPPIDDVKLQLMEITQHTYTVGYGKGTGAGFSGGTRRGVVRLIRLEYAGGDWDQDFGVGADLNMLVEYGVRTQHKIAKRTESRKVAQLKSFPAGKSPPVVYMTGQRNISLSGSEIRILREYLLEKHGMIFADNGGSGHWHGQFFNLMRRVLPKVEPVRVPLDDVVHRVPYPIPFLPYVAPHGGKDAWGWKVDGRWVVYYHPGDIGDAWADGHAGVRTEIWEFCYQLGVNVIFYAHAEYNKWLDARGGASEE